MLTLSAATLVVIGLVGLLALFIAFGLGYSCGHDGATEQIKQQARDNGVDPRWLGIRTPVRSDDE